MESGSLNRTSPEPKKALLKELFFVEILQSNGEQKEKGLP
jgi:hypothetical protein